VSRETTGAQQLTARSRTIPSWYVKSKYIYLKIELTNERLHSIDQHTRLHSELTVLNTTLAETRDELEQANTELRRLRELERRMNDIQKELEAAREELGARERDLAYVQNEGTLQYAHLLVTAS
jgi:DNA repair exonuclease SbcCD ATPase subunit